MQFNHFPTACMLALLTACGGGANGGSAAQKPPEPSITLVASAPSAMINGASVEVQSTQVGLAVPVSWSLSPASAGRLISVSENHVAFAAAADATPDKVTITAKAADVSQSIQLDLTSSPQLVPYLELPHVWTYGPLNDVGYPLAGARPMASASDQAGNLYLSYSSPVSEIKKVGTDGSITSYAKLSDPRSLAFGPNGVLYVVDSLASGAYAIRRVAPDGTITTLTHTAPFDYASGTVDGAAGVATAYRLTIAVSPDGVVYATDGSRVRKVAPDGSFSTFAGGGCEVVAPTGAGCLNVTVMNGHGASARFMDAGDIVSDAAGNLYVSDYSLIRKITPGADVSTLAGTTTFDIFNPNVDATGSFARFSGNGPITIDASGNLYKLTNEGLMRRITPAGVVSTIAVAAYNYNPMQPEKNIVSLNAAAPGIVVLQSSAALIRVNVK